MMLLIFSLKKITNSILPWGTPSCWLWKFDRVDLIQIFVQEDILDEIGQSASEPQGVEAFHYTIFPDCFICFLQVKKKKQLQDVVYRYLPVLWKFPTWPHDPL